MSGFTVPVSMVASKGTGGAIAAGVIGLLVLLALVSKQSSAGAPANGSWINTGATP